jgi:tetratricopeptide (TPR) repeat protein
VRSGVENAPPPAREQEEPTESDLQPAMEIARELAAWDMNLYRVRTNVPRLYPQLDAVIARLDAVLDERPGAGWARYYRGVARFRRGDLEGALEDVERSIGRVPDLASAHFELGRLYLALYLREHGSAQRHLVPEGAVHELRYARSRVEQARLSFEEARRLRAAGAGWQASYADAVGRLAEQDHAGCVAACEEILASEPDLEEVWKLRGDAQRLLGDDPVASFERAVDVRRSFFEAHLAAAEHLLTIGRPGDGRTHLDAALVVHPGLTAARILAARACLLEGAFAEGVAQAERARAEEPRSYDAAVVLGELRHARGEFDGALEAFEAARGLRGCQNRAMLLAARTLLARAKRTRVEGGDASADLARILEHREHHDHPLDDDPHWGPLFRDVDAMLSS